MRSCPGITGWPPTAVTRVHTRGAGRRAEETAVRGRSRGWGTGPHAKQPRPPATTGAGEAAGTGPRAFTGPGPRRRLDLGLPAPRLREGSSADLSPGLGPSVRAAPGNYHGRVTCVRDPATGRTPTLAVCGVMYRDLMLSPTVLSPKPSPGQQGRGDPLGEQGPCSPLCGGSLSHQPRGPRWGVSPGTPHAGKVDGLEGRVQTRSHPAVPQPFLVCPCVPEESCPDRRSDLSQAEAQLPLLHLSDPYRLGSESVFAEPAGSLPCPGASASGGPGPHWKCAFVDRGPEMWPVAGPRNARP